MPLFLHVTVTTVGNSVEGKKNLWAEFVVFVLVKEEKKKADEIVHNYVRLFSYCAIVSRAWTVTRRLKK
jgi:hypothetical protein